MSQQTTPRKVALVGVVGRTNAGKSTLVNRLVGEKVSIVSPVEQTTRNTIRGIVEDPRGQLVLLDTPGLHRAEGSLGKRLNAMARASSSGVDILLVVFDAAHAPQLEDEGWMRRVIKEKPTCVIFALNKNDAKPFFESMFHDLWASLTQGLPASEAPHPLWVCACAIRPKGCDTLLDKLFDCAQVGPELFPSDVVTDYPRRLACADVIREKLIQRMHDEVPHELGVVVDSLVEKQGRWDIEATIYVNRPSQKGIVIGAGGAILKRVRQIATRELADMFGVRITLNLWVKVASNWMTNTRLLTEMGYLGELQ